MEITPYIADILAQPTVLQRCIDSLPQDGALNEVAAGGRNGRYQRIILTGMGSSFFAAYPLYYRLLRAGYAVLFLETSELIHITPELIAPTTLLVVVSQSGESAEVAALLAQAQGKVDILGVTNGAQSVLAQHSAVTLLLHAGTENSVSCKTYLNTLAALAAVGDALLMTDAWLPQLAAVPSIVANYLKNWQGHVAYLQQQLATIDHLFVLGRGASLAAAHTGALIIKEAARFPAQAMSSAAFRHGPIEMSAPNMGVFVYAGQTAVQNMNGKLVQDIQTYGGGAYLIKNTASTLGTLALTAVPLPALPLLEILPAQMLSLALGTRSSHEVGLFQFAAKVTRVE